VILTSCWARQILSSKFSPYERQVSPGRERSQVKLLFWSLTIFFPPRNTADALTRPLWETPHLATEKRKFMRAAVGILAACCHLPQHKRSVEDLFQEEGANFSADVAARLGIKQVPIGNSKANESASNMAVA